MRTKNPALVLLENGIHFSTLVDMSEKQIRVLSEKFNKSETKEQVTKATTTTYTIPSNTAKTTGADIGNMNIKVEPTGVVKATEIKEKFESKAQQGLFWARCNKCSDKNCKWCKMAKEFSDSTSKKDYEKMPEKKHPEKTVKYKKKVSESQYERELENIILEMLSKHINPNITNSKKRLSEKKDSMILRNPKKMSMFSDESGIEMKTMDKPIGKLYSMGKSSMEENDTKEKERTKEKEPGTKNPPKRRGNPFKNPNPGVKESPRGNKEEMKQDFIKWIKQALS
jgi:hypothetical protein